jgi:uncharacterized protein (DUF2147 family)
MKKIIAICFTFLVACVAHAQVAGTWKTIDDETNEAKSYITLSESGGRLQGQVSKLLKSAPDTKCDNCPGVRKNQLILGMIVLENMQLKDGYYQGGQILDPEKGKWYNCKIWLQSGDANVLVVRGHIGPFYRTQYWYRVQ